MTDTPRRRLEVPRLKQLEWLPPLLVRLFVGYFFFETGLAKAQHLSALVQRFASWGIPVPTLSVPLSVYTELVGGALVAVGLLTRLASVPLIINMLVAIFAVRMKSVGGIDDFVEMDEPLYALSFLWLLIAGPGMVSLDHLLFRRLTTNSSHARAGRAAGPVSPLE